MIDDNLPTFVFKASRDSVKQDATIYLAQYGNEATPVYTLRRPDPATAEARNRYAAAVADCWNSAILYGEVLVEPEWTQPTLSAEEVRRHATAAGGQGGPQALLPAAVALQLYNPDQQVVLRHAPSRWNAGEQWTFELPQQTFRQPSSSSLDHGQDDPGAIDTTPTIALKWKRDGKLSKDFVMYLDGSARALGAGGKKKHKEPDIPLAFFRNLREVTIYEPNLTRLDVEDLKGFEVVLLLAATVIRDVYQPTNLAAVFNVTDGPRPVRRSSAEARLQPSPAAAAAAALPLRPTVSSSQIPTVATPTPPGPASPTSPGPPLPSRSSAAPPANARTQWEIDSETARLRKQVEAEEREAARRARDAAKQARKSDKESERLAKQVAEEEEAAARRRQAEIDRETERLRKQYDAEQKAARKKGKGRAADPPGPPLPPRRSINGPPPGWQAPPNSAWAGGGGSGALYPPGSGGFAGQRPLATQPTAPAPPAQHSGGGGGLFGWGRSRELSPPRQPNRLQPKRSSMF